MAYMQTNSVLAERVLPAQGPALLIRRVAMVVLGIALLTLAAKIKIPLWPSPVPVTLGTFAVLSIGAAYGPRLGLVTIFGYMLIGALGFDVFANSTSTASGLTYMSGSTGGYLLGFVLATAALGWAARRGWDRNIVTMAVAMLIGNALIYVPGLLWLGHLYGWEKPILTWGLTPFIAGDVMKLALAALLFPTFWKLVAKARS